MNAPKFSPWPWHFREGHTPSGQFGYIEAADHNRIVADLPDYKNGSDIECDEPNGRLIAAAPTMYEVLRAIEREGRDANADGDVVIPSEVWGQVCAVLAALAKAVRS